MPCKTIQIQFGLEKDKGLVFIEDIYPLVKEYLDREDVYWYEEEEDVIASIRGGAKRRYKVYLNPDIPVGPHKWGYADISVAVRIEEYDRVISLLRQGGYICRSGYEEQLEMERNSSGHIPSWEINR